MKYVSDREKNGICRLGKKTGEGRNVMGRGMLGPDLELSAMNVFCFCGLDFVS